MIFQIKMDDIDRTNEMGARGIHIIHNKSRRICNTKLNIRPETIEEKDDNSIRKPKRSKKFEQDESQM